MNIVIPKTIEFILLSKSTDQKVIQPSLQNRIRKSEDRLTLAEGSFRSYLPVGTKHTYFCGRQNIPDASDPSRGLLLCLARNAGQQLYS